MINRITSILAALLLSVSSFAQKDFARKVVDTLASPYMGGRGYVSDGNKRAATYLDAQFKSLGLLSFGNSYDQQFDYPINTYPTAYIVSVNGEVTQPGADYIIIPSTPTIKGNYPVVRFDMSIYKDSNKLKDFLAQDYTQTFILIDDSGVTGDKEKEIWEDMRSNPFKARGLIMLCDKLTEETS